MRLVRFMAAGESAWGLVDDDGTTLHHIAGGFRAWSPRIAGGEGPHALPRTGRRYAVADVDLLPPVEEGAAIRDSAGGLLAGSPAIAGARPLHTAIGVALVGAPLVGRATPLRSLFGYGLAWRSADGLALSPMVTTAAGGRDPAGGALAQNLARIDALAVLRSGDLVLFDLAAEAAQPAAPAARVA